MICIVRDLDQDAIKWNPEEEEWSIMQIILHVGESIPFWLKEIKSIGIKENQNAKWGRGFFNKNRLYAICDENIQNTTLDEAIINLEKITLSVKEMLQLLTDDQLQIVASSNYSYFEGKTVQFIVESEIVKHIEGHVGQIKRNLLKSQNPYY